MSVLRTLFLFSLFNFVFAFEPLPASALPTVFPDPQKGYAIVDRGAGAYIITEGVYQFMAVVRRNGWDPTLCVIDQPTGFFSEASFLASIQEVLDISNSTTVSDIIYSHHHTDHIGNAGLLKRRYPGATIHASDETCQRLQKRRDPKRPVPNRCYSGAFHLNNFNLQALDLGSAHTPGNIALLHPPSRTLMYIDVIFPGWSMFRDLAQAEYTPDFLDAFDKILRLDFEVIVGGHLTRFGNRNDVLVQREYVNDMVQNARQALATADANSIAAALGTFDPTSPNFLNYWALYQQNLDAIDNLCTELTLAKWRTRLGGADVFTKSHCSKIVTSVRID